MPQEQARLASPPSSSTTAKAPHASNSTMPIQLMWLDRKNPNALNFLRLGFALLVIVSHAWHLQLLNDPLQQLPQATESLGGVAVNAFFMISGYLITASWLSGRSADHYLKSRILRIVPGFIVAFGVSLVAATANAGPDWLSYLREILKPHLPVDAITLNGMVLNSPRAFANNPYHNAVNGSLWTIPVEFTCYLAVAFIGSLRLFAHRGWITAFVCLAYTAYVIHILKDDSAAVFAWPRFAMTFGIGTLFWLWRDRIPQKRSLAVLSLVSLVTALFFHGAVKPIWPIAGSYLLFYFAFNAPRRLREIGSKNDISYGIYLYGFLIQQVLYRWYPTQSPALNLVLASGLAVLAGWASWLWIERPASRWR